MARAQVSEYTRQLANGTQVTVHQHHRQYVPGADEAGGRTAVEHHRRDRLKEQARIRRAEALTRGREQAKRGASATRRRAKQSWGLCRKGGKRLQRAARYASRRKRAAAAACLVGGVAEIGAAAVWSTTGLIVTTIGIIGAAIGGGLLLGGRKAGD